VTITDITLIREERAKFKHSGQMGIQGYAPSIKLRRAPPPLTQKQRDFAIEDLAKCWANGVRLNDGSRYGREAQHAMSLTSIDPREIPEKPIALQHWVTFGTGWYQDGWAGAIAVSLTEEECAAAMRRALDILREPKIEPPPMKRTEFTSSTTIHKKRHTRWAWLKRLWSAG